MPLSFLSFLLHDICLYSHRPTEKIGLGGGFMIYDFRGNNSLTKKSFKIHKL